MQPQNVSEYLEIRKEQMDLRNCVNLYVGFVVVGARPALFGIIDKRGSGSASSLLAVFTVMLISLILLLLFYKFTSHNRYAGYGKLLTHEQYGSKVPDAKPDVVHLFGWEICLDRLRDRQWNRKGLAEVLKAANIDQNPFWDRAIVRIEELSGERPKADCGAWRKGMGLLFWDNGESNSWGYPIHVSRILAIESVLFLGIAAAPYAQNNGWAWLRAGWSSHLWLIVLAVFGLGVTMFVWHLCLAKLFKLMQGSQTVDAYCWLFLPARVALVSEIFPSSSYMLTGLREALPEIPKENKVGDVLPK